MDMFHHVSFLHFFVVQGKISPGKELFKWFFGRSEHTFAALLFCLMELFILPSSHPVSVKTLSNRDKLREELEVFYFKWSVSRAIFRSQWIELGSAWWWWSFACSTSTHGGFVSQPTSLQTFKCCVHGHFQCPRVPCHSSASRTWIVGRSSWSAGKFQPRFLAQNIRDVQVSLSDPLQVVGNLNNDHLTLAVAAELERAFGGWVCPSPIHCWVFNICCHTW